MPGRYRTYQCRHCSWKGRHYRAIAHVLKEHLPEEEIPYLCTLCGFRCLQAKTLEEHLSSYEPHRREEQRQGQPDYDCILKFSKTPAKVEDHFYEVGASQAAPAETGDVPMVDTEMVHRNGRVLPRWIIDHKLPTPPPITRHVVPPAAPEYVPTPITQQTQQTQQTQLPFPVLSFDALLSDTPYVEDWPVSREGVGCPKQQGPATAIRTPVLHHVLPRQNTPAARPTPPSGEQPSNQPSRTPLLNQQRAFAASATSTPLQDEVDVGVMPTAADEEDPLQKEEEVQRKRRQEQPESPESKRQRSDTAEVIAAAVSTATTGICKVLEAQTRTLQAMQTAMERQKEDSARLERRVSSILHLLEDYLRSRPKDVSAGRGPTRDAKRK